MNEEIIVRLTGFCVKITLAKRIKKGSKQQGPVFEITDRLLFP